MVPLHGGAVTHPGTWPVSGPRCPQTLAPPTGWASGPLGGGGPCPLLQSKGSALRVQLCESGSPP